MENLLVSMEKAMGDCIEGEFGVETLLTGPDGVTQKYSANDQTQKLKSMVRYSIIQEDPDTGAPTMVNEPVMTFRLSALDRVPVDGENWHVFIPVSPKAGAALKSFLITPARAKEGETDMGSARFRLSEAIQS